MAHYLHVIYFVDALDIEVYKPSTGDLEFSLPTAGTIAVGGTTNINLQVHLRMNGMLLCISYIKSRYFVQSHAKIIGLWLEMYIS